MQKSNHKRHIWRYVGISLVGITILIAWLVGIPVNTRTSFNS